MENSLVIDVEKMLLTANGPLRLQISATFVNGELVVFYGDSGAGKTTLLRMIAGLTTPDNGKIIFNNEIWFDSSQKINIPPQKRSIGFMFQDYALFPTMTVAENIYFAQSTKDKPSALRLLQNFGLEEFANKKPHKLSGGQKQRVALARALARKPGLLLLDEPLSALDNTMRRTLQDEILHAHNLNNAITLLVSHDLSEVFRLAQKVLHIEKGIIKKFGTPDEVFIDSSMSSKVQITGKVVRIQQHDTFAILTIVTGMNQIIKVTAFESDLENLSEGDCIVVLSKALNPMIMKI